MQLKVKKLHPDAKLPTQAHPDDAGWDLYCVADDSFESVDYNNYKYPVPVFVLHPGESHIFHTGISCSFDPGYVALLWDRSGMGAKRQLHRLAGVIDCSWRGEYLVCLVNLGSVSQTIYAGDKIIQVLFQEISPVEIVEVDELDSTERGDAGFGSTGS